ncbi:MATE family efflux transporter [Lawsonibacter sp.]|uniref:MATE family efflux transporter n=1 Tax=Lawsonibacter sp. TaxID=2185275 RepID=UPI0025838A25|nr:MATE family efflux transporter [Lawsonibacter sp.]MCI6398672.1 MATE family efflux transporter [Lawsonibacter sp.]MDY2976899.1 MATE family efflux transporter [Oscillospiraceae bacterium]
MPQTAQENKMGVMPVRRLLITMALPMMISMLVQALYNVVGSIFVAQISESALTAVSLVFPFQNLMISIGVGTAVGVNALLSRSLGEKNFALADQTAENGVFLSLLSYLAVLVLSLTLAQPFMAIQIDDPEIISYGVSYLRLVGGLSVGMFAAIMLERLLQSTGRTFYTMITQGLGAVINIVLDPLMIFGIGPFPEMGVAGAALATVIGQCVGAVLALYYNIRHNPEIHPRLRGFRPNGAVIRRIYAVGVPSILLSSIGSVMTFGMNQILTSFTSTATAVFGIYFKVQSFAFMPIFGLNNGMVPIVSYNLGAQKKKRLVGTVKFAFLLALCIMIAGFLVFQLLPAPILRLFDASDTMLSIGVPALRIISISFLLASGSIISISTLQALGKGVQSMMISFTRQLIVLLPVAWLLSLRGTLESIWWAFPIAEVVTLALSVFLLAHAYRTLVKPMPDEE